MGEESHAYDYLVQQMTIEIDLMVMEKIRNTKLYKTKRNIGVHVTYKDNDFIL